MFASLIGIKMIILVLIFISLILGKVETSFHMKIIITRMIIAANICRMLTCIPDTFLSTLQIVSHFILKTGV